MSTRPPPAPPCASLVLAAFPARKPRSTRTTPPPGSARRRERPIAEPDTSGRKAEAAGEDQRFLVRQQLGRERDTAVFVLPPIEDGQRCGSGSPGWRRSQALLQRGDERFLPNLRSSCQIPG